MLTNITLFDSSFSLKDWETGSKSIYRPNQWMSFDGEVDGQKVSFDVTFDISGDCDWYIERGNYWENELDYIEQNDVNITIDIKEFYSEDITLTLTDEIKTLLTESIKSNI